MRAPAHPARPYGTGVAGLLASVPLLGPALAAMCLACVGFGGAAVAGASLAVPTMPFLIARVGILALSWWRSLRRARRSCGPAECRRLARGLPIILGGVALATYLIVRLVMVPFLVKGLIELGDALSHRPSLP